MSEPLDVLDQRAGAPQLSLFDGADTQMHVAPRRFAPDPDIIRQRLHALLARAREARTMPWPERDARMWQTVFPQMADWLPDAEASALRVAFAAEIGRLKAA